MQIKKVLDSCFSTFSSPPRLCRSPPSSLCQAKGGFKTFIDCETLRIWPVPAVISCLREEISHHPPPKKPTPYAWFCLNGPTVLLGSDPPGSCVCVCAAPPPSHHGGSMFTLFSPLYQRRYRDISAAWLGTAAKRLFASATCRSSPRIASERSLR